MISKAEMKVAIAGEFEQGFGDAKAAAEQDTYRWDGAKTSLKGAVKSVDSLLAHIARDVKEGILDADGAKIAQRYVQRASALVDNIRLKAEVHEQRARGRMEAMSMAANMATRMGQQAQRRIETDAQGPGEPGDEPQGRHPGNRRAALKDRNTEAPSEPEGNPPEKETKPELAVPQNGAKPKAKKKVTKKAVKKKPTRKKAIKKG